MIPTLSQLPATTQTPAPTAGDLMSRDVKAIGAGMPLGDAAAELARLGVRGAPVVDDGGRCVGVLSESDLSRWAAGADRPGTPRPRTCSFQEVAREPGGRETVRCLQPDGTCPFQRPRAGSCGRGTVCAEPHCVPTDWQMVETEPAPRVVRDVMTTEVVSVDPDAPVHEVARAMLDHGVRRLLVLDPAGRPVGVVSANDLLPVLAHPEFAAGDGL